MGRQLQAVLSELILRDGQAPGGAFLTIREVQMTGDLKNAHVTVSVLGAPEARTTAWDALQQARGRLRREVGQRLDLRYTPALHFHLLPDQTPEERALATLDRLFPRGDGDGETS